MNDFVREYVKKGFIDAVGKEADHWIRLKSAEWHKDGVLTTEDLAEIKGLIDAKNNVGISEEA